MEYNPGLIQYLTYPIVEFGRNPQLKERVIEFLNNQTGMIPFVYPDDFPIEIGERRFRLSRAVWNRQPGILNNKDATAVMILKKMGGKAVFVSDLRTYHSFNTITMPEKVYNVIDRWKYGLVNANEYAKMRIRYEITELTAVNRQYNLVEFTDPRKKPTTAARVINYLEHKVGENAYFICDEVKTFDQFSSDYLIDHTWGGTLDKVWPLPLRGQLVRGHYDEDKYWGSALRRMIYCHKPEKFISVGDRGDETQMINQFGHLSIPVNIESPNGIETADYIGGMGHLTWNSVGQYKLYLALLYMSVRSKSNYCLYVGGSPGFNLECFPHITFLVIDPRPVKCQSLNITSIEMFATESNILKIILDFKKIVKGKTWFFMSDIRTDKDKNQDLGVWEILVHDQTALSIKLADIALNNGASLAMIKFREDYSLYDEHIFEYKTTIVPQAYNKYDSNEVRVVMELTKTMEHKVKPYDMIRSIRFEKFNYGEQSAAKKMLDPIIMRGDILKVGCVSAKSFFGITAATNDKHLTVNFITETPGWTIIRDTFDGVGFEVSKNGYRDRKYNLNLLAFLSGKRHFSVHEMILKHDVEKDGWWRKQIFRLPGIPNSNYNSWRFLSDCKFIGADWLEFMTWSIKTISHDIYEKLGWSGNLNLAFRNSLIKTYNRVMHTKATEVAGHMIAMLLGCHYGIVDINRYMDAVEDNYFFRKDYFIERNAPLWHTFDEWMLGVHAYTIIASRFFGKIRYIDVLIVVYRLKKMMKGQQQLRYVYRKQEMYNDTPWIDVKPRKGFFIAAASGSGKTYYSTKYNIAKNNNQMYRICDGDYSVNSWLGHVIWKLAHNGELIMGPEQERSFPRQNEMGEMLADIVEKQHIIILGNFSNLIPDAVVAISESEHLENLNRRKLTGNPLQPTDIVACRHNVVDWINTAIKFSVPVFTSFDSAIEGLLGEGTITKLADSSQADHLVD